MTLTDTWATRAAPAGTRRPVRPAREPSEASPPRKGRGEARAEQRAADPALAALHARLAAIPGLSADQADLLSADAATAAWFHAAVATGASPGPTARWLLNELLGLAGDAPLGSLSLPAADFGRFVVVAESGRTTGAGAKALLASLVDRPGDPSTRLAELGLEKVDDRAAVDVAVARVLAAKASEVARYRAGETKLLAFLLGAVMRETQGKADPNTIRMALQEALG
jgi:Asp-tRNA(Asn)/Glu-tRNA(Gln) amidotransferase B subunit